MTATKPREFWIRGFKFGDNENACQNVSVNLLSEHGAIHAIEVSALLAKDEKIKELILVNAELAEGFWNRGRRINELEEELKAYKMGSRFEAKEGDDARSENARLRELLENYGSHKFHCDENQGTEGECTCGFLKALSGGEV